MKFEVGLIIDIEQTITELETNHYSRTKLVLNPGEYAIRGSIIDIFPSNSNAPIRLELFDTVIDDIRTFEPTTQRSLSKNDRVEIAPYDKSIKRHEYVIPHEILFDLSIGDKVVHINHGIGIYQGLERMKFGEFEGEYAVVEYQEGDKIFIPIEQLARIYKFSGGISPVINSLRDKQWEKTQQKVKKVVKDIAKDLFSLYKNRKLREGFAFQEDSELILQMEETFPFQETRDQLKAIEDIRKDMESRKAMDRLVCGDVGFGKTEVAIRAALKAVISRKQVAVLAPTTILSKQHYEVFKCRIGSLGVNVEFINRFKTKKEQKETLNKLKMGTIDVIVGTHRLLQKDIEFADLGLLIIDEEQRFGVIAKEMLKKYRSHIDVLTLSATPLPRTLYMSISGIRDISVINTPPLERLPILTESHEFDIGYIRDKIKFELKRKGQVFILHNRISDIIHLQNQIHNVLPEIDIRVGHGQMSANQLEQLMIDFYEGKFPVLIATTIIENGVDIPNAHTMIINNAEHFGLAQLHQLRGRVGRNQVQSYCYLLYKDKTLFTQEVKERFEALMEFSALGSGYDIALRDLELRGIGNILGTAQSGYMEAVGFEFYMHILNEAIAREKGEKHRERPYLNISTRMEAYIPEEYIPDMSIRLALYKSIAVLSSKQEVINLVKECEDRFGKLPDNLVVMLQLISHELDE
ncbi:MAG: transcription-repair coupling factor [Candidatus Margulisbacteria bacterium]|nr:transcription-repair coupling factor [Candidatus Margulisiibacteriota bacterium]